jgi:hypothetical protein
MTLRDKAPMNGSLCSHCPLWTSHFESELTEYIECIDPISE